VDKKVGLIMLFEKSGQKLIFYSLSKYQSLGFASQSFIRRDGVSRPAG